MRAEVYYERIERTVEDHPVPMPGPTEGPLRVRHCGVCGTDLHFVKNGSGRPRRIAGKVLVAPGPRDTRFA